MEQKGVLYPAEDIGDLLRSADLTHVSNEIPFAQDCPPPSPAPGLYPFCSDPRYIDLLEFIGTDVVEMTGNHVRDWGSRRCCIRWTSTPSAAGPSMPAGRIWKRPEARSTGAQRQPLGVHRMQQTRQQRGMGDRLLAGSGALRFRLSPNRAGPIAHGRVSSHHDLPVQRVLSLRADRGPGEGFSCDGRRRSSHRLREPGPPSRRPFDFAGGSLIHYGLGNLFFDQYYVMKSNPECVHRPACLLQRALSRR